MRSLKTVPNFEHLSSINPNFRGVLWDMDGTIMETEIFHTNSTLEIIKVSSENKAKNSSLESIFSFEEVDAICCGATDPVILNLLQQKGSLLEMNLDSFISQKNEIIKNLLDSTPTEKIFNYKIKELLEQTHKAGIKQAVVTSSEKRIAKTMIEHLCLNEYFDFILCREDTSENKPSPNPYLKAMKDLNLKPEEVIIFEDSQIGLTAAKASKAIYCKASWYSL